MTESQKLFAEYVKNGSDTAFRGLVNRYVDLVYSAALRLVGGDTHRAQDVAQTVFADLARLARTLSPDVQLGGWLHRHACFVAANTMRGERRRQSRERQAVEMNALQDQPDANLALVAPILDDAINQLGEDDRAAILLRFFEQCDFRSVGEALGSNEDAARMRVSRALDKLQSLLKNRGIATSSAALAVGLAATAVQAAPAGLALTISTTAALAGTTITAATATKIIAMTTIQKALAVTTLAVVTGGVAVQANHLTALKRENDSLRANAPNLEKLRADNAEYQRLLLQNQELDRLCQDNADIPRLRDEVVNLKAQTQTAAQTRIENQRRLAALPRGRITWQPSDPGAAPIVSFVVPAGFDLSSFVGSPPFPASATNQIAALSSAVNMFETDNGIYPRNLSDLVQKPVNNSRNWRGPYLESVPKDPWGNDYAYVVPGKLHPNAYDLISAGPDGRLGTDDDIINQK